MSLLQDLIDAIAPTTAYAEEVCYHILVDPVWDSLRQNYSKKYIEIQIDHVKL